jgi:hypothetical protein
LDIGFDHLTSATAKERNPSSSEFPHELPVVLTTRTVPVLKLNLNSAYRPLAQKFFILPSTGWLKSAEFKKLQTIKVSIWCLLAALFSMISLFMFGFYLRILSDFSSNVTFEKHQPPRRRDIWLQVNRTLAENRGPLTQPRHRPPVLLVVKG